MDALVDAVWPDGLLTGLVRARQTVGGVRLFGELFDRSEAAVPTVGDFGQRAGCFGEALFADLVADLASLAVPVDQSDSLQEQRCLDIAWRLTGMSAVSVVAVA